jgi:hypothetical protein
MSRARISASVAVQNNANEAQTNWEAALQSKDRAIQQLEDALSSKELALAAMAQRERTWRASESKTAAEQQEHEQRMHLLRAQVADANATMAALKEQIRGQGRAPAQPLSPIAEGAASVDVPARPAPLRLDPLAEGAALPDSRSLRTVSLEPPPVAAPAPLPREHAPADLSRTQMAAAEPFEKPIARLHSHAPEPCRAATATPVLAMHKESKATRRPLSPIQPSAVDGALHTFHVEQHTHVHSPPKPPDQPPWQYIAGRSLGRACTEDSENAQEIARTLHRTRRLLVDFAERPFETSEADGGGWGSSRAIEGRLDALLEEQRKLMTRFAGADSGHSQLGSERDGPSLLDRHLAAVTAKADFLAERVRHCA